MDCKWIVIDKQHKFKRIVLFAGHRQRYILIYVQNFTLSPSIVNSIVNNECCYLSHSGHITPQLITTLTVTYTIKLIIIVIHHQSHIHNDITNQSVLNMMMCIQKFNKTNHKKQQQFQMKLIVKMKKNSLSSWWLVAGSIPAMTSYGHGRGMV